MEAKHEVSTVGAESGLSAQNALQCVGRSGVQSVDHHLDLAFVDDEQVAHAEDGMHGVDNFVEAAGRPALLGDSNNTQRVTLAVFNDGHDLGGEGHLLHVEVWADRVSQGSEQIAQWHRRGGIGFTYSSSGRPDQRQCCGLCPLVRLGCHTGAIPSTKSQSPGELVVERS
jgi:hypothetical protein